MAAPCGADDCTERGSQLTSVEIAQQQYDTQAAAYTHSKNAAWREHVEKYTLDYLTGDLRGCYVIDLACGNGHYTRWLRRVKGAKRVLGVDLSAEMIKLALDEETRNPLGIDYVCSDVHKLGGEQVRGYDTVIAAYLLNYASSFGELLGFCQIVHEMLPDGGKFFSINNSPHDSALSNPSLHKYGFMKIREHTREGARVQYKMLDADGQTTCTIDNYAFSRTMFDRAFRQAGFKSFGYASLNVSPAGIDEYGAEYWSDLLDAQPVEGIWAIK